MLVVYAACRCLRPYRPTPLYADWPSTSWLSHLRGVRGTGARNDAAQKKVRRVCAAFPAQAPTLNAPFGPCPGRWAGWAPSSSHTDATHEQRRDRGRPARRRLDGAPHPGWRPAAPFKLTLKRHDVRIQEFHEHLDCRRNVCCPPSLHHATSIMQSSTSVLSGLFGGWIQRTASAIPVACEACEGSP